MADLPTYKRADGAEYTGIASSSGTTPLMTNHEVADAKKGLARLAESDRKLLLGAEQQYQAGGGKVSHQNYLQKTLGDEGYAKFTARYEAAMGKDTPLDNTARVHYDAQAHGGKFANARAVDVGGRPTLPAHIKETHWLKKAFQEVTHAAKVIPGVNKVVGKAAAVGTVLAAVGSLAQANTLDEAAQAGKVLTKETIGLIDPTGLATSAAHKALGLPGRTDFEQTLDAMSNGQRRTDTGTINQHNLALNRQQDFLFHADHPGQLNTLHMQDRNGRAVDIKAALKNPHQRQAVMDEIDRRTAAASPENRLMFADMKEAAQDYADLEDRRRQLPIQPATQVAATPTAPALSL